MNWACYDLETDGLLDTVSKVFCMVVQDHTGKVMYFTDDERFEDRYGSILDGIVQLDTYDWLVGHNIVRYDHAVLKKLYDWTPAAGQRSWDTTIMSRVIWPDLRFRDMMRKKTDLEFPKKWLGSHSLGAWGYRLKNAKAEFDVVGLTELSMECLDYCIQDVAVNVDLFHLQKKRLKGKLDCVEVEHQFEDAIYRMTHRGWAFDTRAASSFADQLMQEVSDLDKQIQDRWPPQEVEYFTPKRKTRKTKTVVFNPNSDVQVGKKLKELGWSPTKFTPTGQPAVTRDILEHLPYPEAALLARRSVAGDLLAKVEGGSNSWLKSVKGDRIYGTVKHMGTRTSRCSHSRPNLGNIPKPGKPFGEECRDLFTARQGWTMVGADASGVDLRSLAHYMNDPSFTDVLLNGDIHTELAKAWGVDRTLGKTLTYAMLYGAQDPKLGGYLGGGKVEGAKARARLMAHFPALDRLIAWAKKQKSFVGLDGRPVPNPSRHASLNTLCQTASSVIMKVATNLAVKYAADEGLVEDEDWALVGHIHDEFQAECRPEVADLLGGIFVSAIKGAGVWLGMNIPLDGEYLVGKTWRATH